eukprot:SAG31_NODE_1479_length_8180_cov_7.141684_5_plen_182_part_00
MDIQKINMHPVAVAKAGGISFFKEPTKAVAFASACELSRKKGGMTSVCWLRLNVSVKRAVATLSRDYDQLWRVANAAAKIERHIPDVEQRTPETDDTLLRNNADDFLYHRLRLINKRLLELIEFLGRSAIDASVKQVLFTDEIEKRLNDEEKWSFSSEKHDFEGVRALCCGTPPFYVVLLA